MEVKKVVKKGKLYLPFMNVLCYKQFIVVVCLAQLVILCAHNENRA